MITTSATYGRPIKIIGRNTDVDDVMEDLWELGGTYVPPPSSGIQLAFKSSSANDTSNGTGIRQVELHYIEAGTYLEKDEHITLNGTTAVLTQATNILFVNGCHAFAVGDNGVAVGNISITNVAESITYGRIASGLNTQLQALFMVPANKQLEINGWDGGSGTVAGGRWTQFLLRITMHDDEGDHDTIDGIFHVWDIKHVQDGSFVKQWKRPITVTSKAIIKISVNSDSAVANAQCAATIDCVLI